MKIEFTPWPKTPRLFRDITITEKIDGSNAAIGIAKLDDLDHIDYHDGSVELFANDEARKSAWAEIDDVKYVLWAQSRKRIVTPAVNGSQTDNHGFAGWVRDFAPLLVTELGVGLHYGEWWGSGINRGYGLTGGDKRFSLFNTRKHAGLETTWGLGVVPVLYEGPFGIEHVHSSLLQLELRGSQAAQGFYRPEGVCVYHQAAGQVFKVTIEGDEKPKGQES